MNQQGTPGKNSDGVFNSFLKGGIGKVKAGTGNL